MNSIEAFTENPLTRAIDKTMLELETDPEIGSIISRARAFVELTKGQYTPWAEVSFDEPIEKLRREHNGLRESAIFTAAVEILRRI